jgi:hypothetical protein
MSKENVVRDAITFINKISRQDVNVERDASLYLLTELAKDVNNSLAEFEVVHALNQLEKVLNDCSENASAHTVRLYMFQIIADGDINIANQMMEEQLTRN